MITRGLGALQNASERAALAPIVCAIAEAAYDRWIRDRTSADNRAEHEFIVFYAAMRIAEAERLPLEDKLAAAAFCFLHDTYTIRRVTEAAIREAAARDASLAAEMEREKDRQRREHMAGGARNAEALLRELRHPERPGEPIVSDAVRARTVEIIAKHDCWKLGEPHPPGADRLAVVCFEADALYPLHPIGVLADLERPDESGCPKDLNDPAEWRKQLAHSLGTLRKYRANWAGLAETFQDEESIFRTAEGYRLYREWLGLWNVIRGDAAPAEALHPGTSCS
jgi:hypothetical protein